MLLEYQEKDVMAGESLPPYPYPVKVLPRYDDTGGYVPGDTKFSCFLFFVAPTVKVSAGLPSFPTLIEDPKIHCQDLHCQQEIETSNNMSQTDAISLSAGMQLSVSGRATSLYRGPLM